VKAQNKVKARRVTARSSTGMRLQVARARNYTVPVGLVRTEGRLAGRGELKNTDQSFTNSLVGLTSSGTIVLLNGIFQGSTANQRDGRNVRMKYLEVRFHLTLAPTTAGGSPLRFVVFYDKQANATPATAVQLLLADAISSPRNLDNSRRFRILSDDSVSGVSVTGPACMKYVKRIALNLPIEFNNGNAGTVGDIVTGALYLGVWSTGAFTVAAPLSTCYTRVYFQG